MTSESYENEDLYDENEEPTDALSSFPESRIPFSREDLMNAESLRSSDYKKIAIDIVTNLPFTMEYKQDLARWAHRSFNKDVILSDNSPRKLGYLIKTDPYSLALESGRLDLMKRRLSRSKSDTLEPAAHTIEDDLMFVYICLLSRTFGVKRERLINNVMKTESETISRAGQLDARNEDRKSKGWFSRK